MHISFLLSTTCIYASNAIRSCSTTRKRQKIGDEDISTNPSRRVWRGNSRDGPFDTGYRQPNDTNQFCRSESYYASQGGDYYARDGNYESVRRYDNDYLAASSTAAYGEWGPVRSSSGWYDERGYASPGWNGSAQPYGDYYGGAGAGASRQYSDESYAYPPFYRSSSVERLDPTSARERPAVASSGDFYRGEEYYGGGRYPDSYSNGFRNAYQDSAQEMSAGGARSGGFRAGRFGGLSSPFRGGSSVNGGGSNSTSRYANTFKARQYSFGAKKATGKLAAGEKVAGGGSAQQAAKAGATKEEAKEPEKPKVITGAVYANNLIILLYFW